MLLRPFQIDCQVDGFFLSEMHTGGALFFVQTIQLFFFSMDLSRSASLRGHYFFKYKLWNSHLKSIRAGTFFCIFVHFHLVMDTSGNFFLYFCTLSSRNGYGWKLFFVFLYTFFQKWIRAGTLTYRNPLFSSSESAGGEIFLYKNYEFSFREGAGGNFFYKI